jgi:hypothetical protein
MLLAGNNQKGIVKFIEDYEAIEASSYRTIISDAWSKRFWNGCKYLFHGLKVKLSFNTTFANDLFAAMDKDSIDWDLKDATENTIKVLEFLTKRKVAIAKLLSKYPEKVFKTKNIKLLETFFGAWAEKDGITKEEKTLRTGVLNNAYVRRAPSEDEQVDFFDDLRKTTNIEVANMLLGRPQKMPKLVHLKYLQEHVALYFECLREYDNYTYNENDLNNEILTLNQVRSYEMWVKSQEEKITLIEKTKTLQEFDGDWNAYYGGSLTTEEAIIKYLEEKNPYENLKFLKYFYSNKKLGRKIKEALDYAGIKKCSYRKEIIDYVMESVRSNYKSGEKALDYAVTVVENNEMLYALEDAKKPLNVQKNDDDDDNKELLTLLNKILDSGRFKRAITSQIIKKFKTSGQTTKEKLLQSTYGYNNTSKMLKVMQALDLETSGKLDLLLSDVMKELKSQDNLDPSLSGAARRKFNSIMSYPIWLFFFVLDSISYICAYYCPGFTAEKSDDVAKKFNSELNKMFNKISIKIIDESTSIPPDDVLRNGLLECLKLYKKNCNNVTVDELKDVIKWQDINALEPSLQTECQQKLYTCQTSKDFACAANKLLEHPKMNEGINNKLLAWSNVARGVTLLQHSKEKQV